jgi:hypothetical protein
MTQKQIIVELLINLACSLVAGAVLQPSLKALWKWMNILVLILMFGTPLASRSQDTGRGTLIIVGYSQNKIIVAADSRKSSYSGNRFTDDDCKLIPFNGFSVFTTAGNVGFRTQHTMGWDGNREADKIIASSKKSKSTGKYLRIAAVEWAQNITAEINRSLMLDREETMQAVEENRILNGIFVGFENGIAAFYLEEIIFDPQSRRATNRLTDAPILPVLQWGAMGDWTAANDVIHGESAFAQRQIREWNLLRPTIELKDRDAYWAIQLVKIGALYDSNRQEIGGPVDALEITAGGIRWVKRKEVCK